MGDPQTQQVLTPEEVAIQKLRSSIEDIIAENDTFDDDYYLLAWLKARNFKPTKTEEMIRNALAWRKKTNLSADMTEENMKELVNEFPIIVDTTSASNGIPMAYAHVGKVDNRKIYAKYGWQAITNYVLKTFLHFEETMIAHNRKQNTGTKQITKDSISGIVAVFNIDGFPKTPSPFIDFTKVFSTVLKVIRPLIPDGGKTFYVYSRDDDGWKGRLKELMQCEDLPDCFQDRQGQTV